LALDFIIEGTITIGLTCIVTPFLADWQSKLNGCPIQNYDSFKGAELLGMAANSEWTVLIESLSSGL